MSEKDDKKRALDLALSQIEKQYGKGAIMKLGAEDKVDVPAISTGSLGLDIALGVGGLPRGRVIEIFGPEASGKTTMTLHCIAEVQKTGGVAAFIDAEHALDVTYAKKLGVQADDLLVSQPDTGEQALEIAETLVRSGAIDLIVVDSVAALTPRAEIEGEMGDAHMGLQARLMSQALTEAHGGDCEIADDGDLHQPNSHEAGRDVRESRDDYRRQRAQILFIRSLGYPPNRIHQRRPGGDGQPRSCEGGKKQDGATVSPGRV